MIEDSVDTLLTFTKAVEQGALCFRPANYAASPGHGQGNATTRPGICRGVPRLSVDTGVSVSDPAFGQSNHNAEAFASIMRALAATGHRTLGSLRGFAPIRYEALCNCTGKSDRVCWGGGGPGTPAQTHVLYFSWLPARRLALDPKGLLFSWPLP